MQNVFVKWPESGEWIVKVIATEINQDGHPETPDPPWDADYALVVSADFDCNGNGQADSFDIAHFPELWPDTNNNGIPDDCE